MKVSMVIAGLGIGGAELSSALLAEGLVRRGVEVDVAGLGADGPAARRLRAAGIPVEALDVHGPATAARAFGKTVRRWRRRPPDVVHGWMVHGNLFSLAAARLAGGSLPVVWSLRMSNMSPSLNKPWTLRLTRWGGKLSGGAAAIVANAEAARRAHEGFGYDPARVRVIPNGIDTELFRPDAEARKALRGEWGVGEGDVLFAWVGRFDAQKAPLDFVRAAGLWRPAAPGARFLLCGPGVGRENAALSKAVEETGRKDRFILLGPRPDVHRLWASADVAVSSSLGEGFPNAVAEAMACGIPCAATDAGDSALVLGDTGFVTPPGDPEALSSSLERLAAEGAEGRRRRGEASRRRIVECYGSEAMVDAYYSLYRSLTGRA